MIGRWGFKERLAGAVGALSQDRAVDFRADRHRDIGDGFEVRPWRTPITGYASFNGIELPVRGSGVWELDDGDFEYIQLEVTSIRHEA